MKARAARLIAVAACVAACHDSTGPSGGPVASVSLSPQGALLHPGGTIPLAARAYASDSTELGGRTVRWFTRDSTVAVVSAEGTVSAMAVGVTWVVAVVDGRSDSAGIRVFPPVQSVTVTPARGFLLADQTLQLTALLKDSAGDTATWNRLNWRSTDSTTLRVTALGMVSAVALGRAAVVVAVDGAEATSVIDVTPPADSIAVVPAAPVIVPGATIQLRYTAFNANGDSLPGRAVIWRSADPARVAVTPGGLVTGQAIGAGVVTAAVDGAADTATVTVRTVRFTAVEPGWSVAACAIGTDSLAYCWGQDRGFRGNPENPAYVYPWPYPVAGARRFRAINSGEAYSCALDTSGAAWCWGYAAHYRLGNNSEQAQDRPVPVSGGFTFVSIASSHWHSCALTATGQAYCWGAGYYGALGTGSVADGRTPSAVLGGLRFVAISPGYEFTCGVATDSLAYCWGLNASGQLGTGDSTNQLLPVPVSGTLRFRTVSTSNSHACGVTTGDAAYCWGSNAYGELGNGTTTLSRVPSPVAGGLRFTSISAGGGHGSDFTCGLTTSGAAYCWGLGTYGQLGNGANTSATAPTPVAGGLTFASLSPGGFHSCGITTAGVAYCWGSNYYGDLGTGTTADSNVPVRVAGQP